MEITGGLTGDQKDETVTPVMHFTNLQSVNVKAVLSPAPGTTVQSVTITASGPASASASGTGTGTEYTASLAGLTGEGEYTLGVTVVVAKNGQTASASLPDDKQLHLLADFTKPQLSYTVPDRHSFESDADILFFNGNDAGTNATLRGMGMNVYGQREVAFTAQVDDLSGLSTTGTNQAVIVGGAFRQTVSLTVPPKTPDAAQEVTLLRPSDELPDLDESVQFSTLFDANRPFPISTCVGRYAFHVHLTDRCGNEWNTETETDQTLLERNAFRFWVDRTPPLLEVGENAITHTYYYRVGPAFERSPNGNGVAARNAYYVIGAFDTAQVWQGELRW